MNKWILRILVVLGVGVLLLWNVTLSREVAETRRLLEEVQDVDWKLEILAEVELGLQGQILDIWETLVQRWYDVEIE